MDQFWKLDSPLKELNEHLEQAYKRVSGLVGFSVGQDRLNQQAFTGTAKNLLDIGTNNSEPFFIRMGQTVGEAASYRPKGQVSLKELAAEVLNEFYHEAIMAFQNNRLRLNDSADQWLIAWGMDENKRHSILELADETFQAPSREEMTQVAWPYVKQFASAGSLSMLAGLACFVALILTVRQPLLSVLGGIAGAVYFYGISRKRLSRQAQVLLTEMPQQLYLLFKKNLLLNQSRYEDIINNIPTRGLPVH